MVSSRNSRARLRSPAWQQSAAPIEAPADDAVGLQDLFTVPFDELQEQLVWDPADFGHDPHIRETWEEVDGFFQPLHDGFLGMPDELSWAAALESCLPNIWELGGVDAPNAWLLGSPVSDEAICNAVLEALLERKPDDEGSHEPPPCILEAWKCAPMKVPLDESFACLSEGLDTPPSLEEVAEEAVEPLVELEEQQSQMQLCDEGGAVFEAEQAPRAAPRRSSAFQAAPAPAPPSPPAPAPPIAKDEETTVMLRNIPNKYTRDMLVERLSAEFRGQFDFLYLPVDFKNQCNVGYGFINFRTPGARDRFAQRFDKVDTRICLPGLNSKKVAEVAPARCHGREENVRRLSASPVMNELRDRPGWEPLLFDSDGNKEPFPKPTELELQAVMWREQRSRQQRRGSNSHRGCSEVLSVAGQSSSSSPLGGAGSDVSSTGSTSAASSLKGTGGKRKAAMNDNKESHHSAAARHAASWQQGTAAASAASRVPQQAAKHYNPRR